VERIRREICDFIDDSDVFTDQKVEVLSGVKKQQLNNFRKTGSGLGFRKLLSIAYVLFKEKADTYITSWCLILDSSEHVRQAFEYACITRNRSLLKELINKYEGENGLIGECVKVYTVIYNYMIDKISGTDLKLQAENLRTINDKSLKLLVKILKLYYYYHSRQYLLLLESVEELKDEIFKLTGERALFIRECYILRLCEILAPANFHTNNLDSTRFYSNILINSKICAKTISEGYYYLGMTYLMEDNEKCTGYLKSGYEILSEIDSDIKTMALYNLNFALAYYGNDLYEERTCASSLKALKYARIGEVDKALYFIEDAIKTEGNSSFKQFYKALALKSKVQLGEVAADFYKEKNLFFYRVVANEIKGLGEDTTFIDSLTKLSLGKGDISNYEKISFSCFSDISDCRCVG
jgi:hypothetical protein